MRALRARLDLDSGYLSRLLRSLEARRAGRRRAEPGRRARTHGAADRAGRAERAVLDRTQRRARRHPARTARPSPARTAGRRRWQTVERLLTAGLVEIALADPTSEAARLLHRRTSPSSTGASTAASIPASTSLDADDLRAPAGLLLVARLRGQPVGCGALKFHGTEPAEIKRMWVAAGGARSRLGRRLLDELEEPRRAAGARGPARDQRRPARGDRLYRSPGYLEVEPFNDERYAHHWFEKQLHA